MSRCIIMGAAPIENPSYINDLMYDWDFIICADGGLNVALELGIKPNLIIGDFDSADKDIPEGVEVIKFPTKKNDTDMMCAVKEGLSRGFDEFMILGGLGGRLDHTFSNLSVINYLSSHGAKGVLVDEKNEAFVASHGTVSVIGRKGNTISVFPFATRSCLVSYDGFEYPIANSRLYSDCSQGPMGVSNRLLSDRARITVHEGPALIIMSRD